MKSRAVARGCNRGRFQTVVVLAGEVPPVGRVLEHPSGWRLEVTGGDERRLTRLRLHAPVVAHPDEEE